MCRYQWGRQGREERKGKRGPNVMPSHRKREHRNIKKKLKNGDNPWPSGEQPQKRFRKIIWGSNFVKDPVEEG